MIDLRVSIASPSETWYIPVTHLFMTGFSTSPGTVTVRNGFSASEAIQPATWSAAVWEVGSERYRAIVTYTGGSLALGTYVLWLELTHGSELVRAPAGTVEVY